MNLHVPGRQRRSKNQRVIVTRGLVSLVAAVGMSACSTSSTKSAPPAPTTVVTPLATTVETSEGAWATIAMGHLGQPQNTFWQLFFQPKGGSSWSDKVAATAVATNGGLVLASAGGGLVVVGVEPSEGLRFSPLIASSDSGHSWSNGLLDQGLSSRPDALALNTSGGALALVGTEGATSILEVRSTNSLSSWRTMAIEKTLASSLAESCGVQSIEGVTFAGARPAVGVSCSRHGIVGVAVEQGGTWHLIGPTLPSSLADDSAAVLGFDETSTRLSVLVELSSASGHSLIEASTPDGGSGWSLSPSLPLTSFDEVTSYGPAKPNEMFVLLAVSRGRDRLELVGGSGKAWQSLPSPPVGTATIAFPPGATAEALAEDNSVLTVWRLNQASDGWVKTQVMTVPIGYGSSG